ncbi:G/T mismatch-specific thymine DNA glycosylase-like [Athalia rosae]|uniref:G/T mismatch-specific thymine DNA glycosylase-like n=1 Tax=Athalia rosae TaxID=37344 RepID=UPI002033A024|nr:G/T mismatch-specific thymine DNA glycosylase-like [Athalia rosae]
MSSLRLNKLKKKALSDLSDKPKKKTDRFEGLTAEVLQSCKLPDILQDHLDMVFVGINPSLTAAYRKRYYAGPGNHFYKLLYESGLTPRLLSHEEDSTLLEYSIGLTNIVERPSRSSSDLKKSEIKEGAKRIEKKLMRFQPKVAIFNGKGIYEIFSNKSAKSDFSFGLQPVRIGNTAIWVVPSSSARCAHFPRMVDKLHFYSALSKYLLHLNGKLSEIDEREFSFEGKCKISIPTTSKMWRRKETSAFMHGGRVANKETLLNISETSLPNVHSPDDCSVELKIAKNSEMIECELSFEKNLDESTQNQTKATLDHLNVQAGHCEEKSVEVESNHHSCLAPINRIECNHTVDFVDLIKQRLSQKDTSDANDSVDFEDRYSNHSNPTVQRRHVTKLKYSMLKLNRSNFFEFQKSRVKFSDSDT